MDGIVISIVKYLFPTSVTKELLLASAPVHLHLDRLNVPDDAGRSAFPRETWQMESTEAAMWALQCAGTRIRIRRKFRDPDFPMQFRELFQQGTAASERRTRRARTSRNDLQANVQTSELN